MFKSAIESYVKDNNSEKIDIKESKKLKLNDNLTASDKEISNYEKLTDCNNRLKELEEHFEREKYDAKLYKNHPSRLNIIKQADKLFKGVDGYTETKNLTLSSNDNKSRGHFGEIIRGIRAERAGYKVEAFGKYVNNRQTDIDLLLKDKDSKKLIWLENKEVYSGITNDSDFKTKIDKMANALRYGVIDGNQNFIKPNKAVFINSGPISENAKLYARERDVEIYDNVKSNRQTEEVLKKIKGA